MSVSCKRLEATIDLAIAGGFSPEARRGLAGPGHPGPAQVRRS